VEFRGTGWESLNTAKWLIGVGVWGLQTHSNRLSPQGSQWVVTDCVFKIASNRYGCLGNGGVLTFWLGDIPFGIGMETETGRRTHEGEGA
jgi:hypothetical protein